MIIINTSVKGKKYRVSIAFLLIVAVVVVFFIFKSEVKSEPLASVEVFNDIDFKSNNADVDGHKKEFKNTLDEHLTELKLSNDEKTLILTALENSVFERIPNANTSDGDYLINISLNKRYEIYLDSTNKQLIFANEHDNDSNHRYYKFTNDSGLFKLLEESTKETLDK
ncbi:hypothetical protein [Lysinibacillus agricola]|uniref:hypothetical protein n=1 Tax=Lysinibacillus agricola TaxID=2590012 RepID=UPI003C2C0CB4